VTSRYVDMEPELRQQWPVLYHEPIECGADVPRGWVTLVRELSEELEPMAAEFGKKTRPVVQQLKQKMGELRAYVPGATQEMNNAILRAEERSRNTCEICGRDGSGRNQRGWKSTMCDGCFHG
jgi:hypothetical protein